MNRMIQIAFLVILAGSCFWSSAYAQVCIERLQDDKFRLTRNSKPYRIKGVGGDSNLARLAAAGGNSVRTWDCKNLKQVLDEAHKHGLTVCAGLWLGHQRHGFDYQNQSAVLEQLEEKLAYVQKFKDHPALLMWGVGNEAEGEGNDPSVWYAINHVAREIKRIDPEHPTMTVIAELGEDAAKVRSIDKFCPHIDIIGINAYGGIETVGQRYATADSSKPYIVTEHGTLGPWEVEKTAWGSPIEWTSTKKGDFYARGYHANAVANSNVCLGTYAFIWGHKQETTATWFGMLLEDGNRLAATDSMSALWTGRPVENKCPIIEELDIKQPQTLSPGDKISARLIASDPEDDPLRYQWVLRSDSGTIGEGGDPQEDETTFNNAVSSRGHQATIVMPEGGGGYRLFAYVMDDKGGAAVANVPLNVPAPIKLAKVLPASAMPYVLYEEASSASVFVPSGYMGNAEAIAMQLDCGDNPRSGTTCIKAAYKSAASWGGVLWQSPAGDWDGKLPGGANLSEATHLEFYARGSQGNEKVNFVFGVLNGNQPYRDTAKGELTDVKLSTSWQRMTIPLRGLDLRQIKTGFGWSLAGQGKPITFFLDDIRYITEN